MRMSGESKDILQLTNLERESSGDYSCGALNAEGETRSSSIVLTVQCKNIMLPKFIIGSCK